MMGEVSLAYRSCEIRIPESLTSTNSEEGNDRGASFYFTDPLDMVQRWEQESEVAG